MATHSPEGISTATDRPLKRSSLQYGSTSSEIDKHSLRDSAVVGEQSGSHDEDEAPLAARGLHRGLSARQVQMIAIAGYVLCTFH
jgi:amino acid permease